MIMATTNISCYGQNHARMSWYSRLYQIRTHRDNLRVHALTLKVFHFGNELSFARKHRSWEMLTAETIGRPRAPKIQADL